MESYANTNSYIKIKAKALLCGCGTKLFLISFISIVLRAALIIAVIPGVYLIVRPSLAGVFAAFSGNKFTSGLILFAAYVIRVIICMLAAALRLGEQYAYFSRAAGKIPKFRYLFLFFSPQKSMTALSLCSKLLFYRAAWLCVFMLPGALVLESAVLIYYKSSPDAATVIILICGSLLLFAVGLVFFCFSRARFIAAPFFIMGKSPLKSSAAVKKSLSVCDTAIYAFAAFRASLTGWYALCFTGIGIIYALPYIKLADAVFALNAAKQSKSPADTDMPIIFTGLASA